MDKTKLAVELFDYFADTYQEKYMDVSLYHDSFDFFCNAIAEENANILELACGPGNITKYLLAKRPDFKILGTDLSTQMIELAKNNNPSADFLIMDSRHIDKIKQQYEAIMCGFCLPYLSKEDALKLIRDAYAILKPKGIFYLSTMEDDYSKSDFQAPSSGGDKKMFIHYHQADYLTEGLNKSGFKILDITFKKHPNQEGTTARDLIIIARRK